MGLATFPMVTGGKGVHVIAPLTPSAEWPVVKDFAHRFALALAQAEPGRFTAALAKAKRTGRIFIDYLRNQRGATAVMPYSARTREYAPIAVPLTWEELRDLDKPSHWHIGDGAEMPDIVVLQELKAPQEKFPLRAIRDLGYDAIWHGQKSWNGVAILSRVGEIHETRRGLPGDPDDSHIRYIEAAVNGILIGGLYLPNGNPRPGPKFDYKLRWFERLIAHAAGLLETGLPVMLAGDFNVMPTELDVYKPERWLDDALFAPEVRAAYFRLLDQGWADALRILHPGETIYTFWDYFRNAYARNAGLRIDHLLL
ncbi:hypothetical protein LTR94_027540, partial [Friedmanniomyces endolithicus]